MASQGGGFSRPTPQESDLRAPIPDLDGRSRVASEQGSELVSMKASAAAGEDHSDGGLRMGSTWSRASRNVAAEEARKQRGNARHGSANPST